jgi:hypothetical protein
MAKRLKGIPNLPFAPIVAALFGLVSAILVFATPGWLLERAVGASGLSSAIAAAQPPLGDTARTLIAVVVGLAVGLVLWVILRVIEKQVHAARVGAKSRPVVAGVDTIAGSEPVSRRASGRAPIFAGQELGAPLMSDEALASGEELFLDPTMLEEEAAPLVLEKGEPEQEQDIVLEAPDFPAAAPIEAEPALVLEAPEQERVAEPAPDPVFEAAKAASPPAQPGIDDDEPTLVELVNRFELALQKRKARVAAGEAVAASPIAGTVANLRELIGGVHKSAA